MRRLATGEPYSSLETRFQISKTVLVEFCHKFLQWFLMNYYTMYVGGLSGVGFDTKSEIEDIDRLFRVFGLPDFITTMDSVHMSYDRAPFPDRHLFIGKEGYPTVGVNMYSNVLGWVDIGVSLVLVVTSLTCSSMDCSGVMSVTDLSCWSLHLSCSFIHFTRCV